MGETTGEVSRDKEEFWLNDGLHLPKSMVDIDPTERNHQNCKIGVGRNSDELSSRQSDATGILPLQCCVNFFLLKDFWLPVCTGRHWPIYCVFWTTVY